MKTLTYNTTATKEVTFSRTETNTIEIAINGVKVGSTSTNNVAKETL